MSSQKELSSPSELRISDDLQNEQFCVSLPKMKLYWLTMRKYSAIARYTMPLHLDSKVVRNKEFVKAAYETIWNLSNEDYTKQRDARRDIFLVNNQPVYTNGWFLIKTYLEVLLEIITQLDAGSVLEVGSGRGKNLALLALRKPSLEFTGLELTHQGLVQSHDLVERLPPKYLSVAGCGSLNREQEIALKKINFCQGSALSMPFLDKSFDLSFTSLVLEQIPHQYSYVIEEMRRVTRKYCVFIEAFTEANNVLGRAYLRKIDYFRASYKSFTKFGLEPVFFTSSLPQKLTYKAGVLVARVLN